MVDRARLFRTRAEDDEAKVTNIELFFDLVFVFAVTQLSQRLLHHLTPVGAAETLILFLGVWWLWIYTSWATNWLDPDRGPVRAMLIAMMFGGLILSGALPGAFGDEGTLFAAAYVAMQLARTLLIVWAARGVNRERMRNFLRIAFYFALSAPLWIGGALLDSAARPIAWAAALAIEYAGPFTFFRTPGLGRSSAADWDISGKHMAERCSLFIIIALGEAILVTGATYAALPHDAATDAALVAGFAISAAMWWIYFDTGAERAGQVMEETEDTGRLARNAYTYLHMPIVAGVVVSAVAAELMLAHPLGDAGTAFVATACGGPLLFLLGNQGFKWMTAGRRLPPLSHAVGEALLIALAAFALWRGGPPLLIGALAAAALIATAGWEWLSLNGGWQRWAPGLGKRIAIALGRGDR